MPISAERSAKKFAKGMARADKLQARSDKFTARRDTAVAKRTEAGKPVGEKFRSGLAHRATKLAGKAQKRRDRVTTKFGPTA